MWKRIKLWLFGDEKQADDWDLTVADWKKLKKGRDPSACKCLIIHARFVRVKQPSGKTVAIDSTLVNVKFCPN